LHARICEQIRYLNLSIHLYIYRERQVRYLEFSQILHDFHEEHAIQAFRKYDTTHNGHILASHFKEILLQLKSHLLSPYMKENIEQVNRLENILKKIFYFIC